MWLRRCELFEYGHALENEPEAPAAQNLWPENFNEDMMR